MRWLHSCQRKWHAIKPKHSPGVWTTERTRESISWKYSASSADKPLRTMSPTYKCCWRSCGFTVFSIYSIFFFIYFILSLSLLLISSLILRFFIPVWLYSLHSPSNISACYYHFTSFLFFICEIMSTKWKALRLERLANNNRLYNREINMIATVYTFNIYIFTFILL